MEADRPQPVVNMNWMIRRHLPDVLAIEQASYPDPWSEEDFCRCLRQRSTIGLVAVTLQQELVGFMVYELHKTHLQLLDLAVAPAWRRLGVGTQLVEKLKGKLAPARRSELCLEVRESNLPAQLFFRALGLRAVAVLHNYCGADDREDAYRMRYRLPREQPVGA